MTKRELANEIAKELGIAVEVAEEVLNTYANKVKEQVATGEAVHLRGFGSFKPVWRVPKIGRNISAGTAVLIPGHYTPVFQPANDFKQAVKGELVEA